MRAWCAEPLGRTCDWRVEGDPEHVDREARRHTGEARMKGGPPGGHATVTAQEAWT